MRIESSLSPWSEFNRAWNLMDRYWPSRDYDLVSATFPIDMYQQDSRVIVRASIPGVKPEDISVNLEQNVLTISGETSDTFEEGKGGRVFHREHSYGKFLRSIRLPAGIDESRIDAQLDNGILTVSIPLAVPANMQPKRIQVRTEGGDKHAVEARRSEGSRNDGQDKQGPDRQKEVGSHTGTDREKTAR